MLYNIFLFKGKNFQDLDGLNIYNYPDEIITIDNTDLIGKIIYGHDHGDIIQKYRNGKNGNKTHGQNRNQSCIIDSPVPQVIDDLNIFTSCINGKVMIGLIFDKEDNPYDYREIFEEILNEVLNIEFSCSFDDEIEIENFLISMFIDIRRYGDEVVDKHPAIEIYYQDGVSKVFLFGIDEVGKSSLVRRLKTGEYSDNFFTPTRKFVIDYVQNNETLLAFWDMPGQRTFRQKWLIGVQDSNIIVFMIDLANQLRFEESKIEFWKVLNRYELSGIPLLILGNKCDLINRTDKSDNDQIARLKSELFTFFELDNIQGREWKFLFTSVKTNFNMDMVITNISDLI